MTIELKHSGFYFVEVTIKQLRDRLKECEDKIEATAEVKREATPEIWSCDTNVIFKLGRDWNNLWGKESVLASCLLDRFDFWLINQALKGFW